MVLVAEDEFRIREVLVDTLLDAGYDVVDAANGMEAVQKAQQYVPDVVLLDVMMPELDGFQVMEQMKANLETESIPVILLTAMPADEGESAAMEAGTTHSSADQNETRVLNWFLKDPRRRRLARGF